MVEMGSSRVSKATLLTAKAVTRRLSTPKPFIDGQKAPREWQGESKRFRVAAVKVNVTLSAEEATVLALLSNAPLLRNEFCVRETTTTG